MLFTTQIRHFVIFVSVINVTVRSADDSTWEDPDEDILLGWLKVKIKDFSPTIADNPICSASSELNEKGLNSCTRDKSPCSTQVQVVCTAVKSQQIVFNNSLALCAAAGELQAEDETMREVVLYQTQKRQLVEDDISARFTNDSLPQYLRDVCDLPEQKFTSEHHVCRYLTCNLKHNLRCTLNNETPVDNFQCATLNLNTSREAPWLQQNTSSPDETTHVLRELPPSLVSGSVIHIVVTSLLLLVAVLLALSATLAVLYCKARGCCCFTLDQLGDEMVHLEIRSLERNISKPPVNLGYDNLTQVNDKEEYQVPVDRLQAGTMTQ